MNAREGSLSSTETRGSTEGGAYDSATECEEPQVVGVLEVHSDGGVAQYCVSTGITYIGRAPDCDVVLPSKNVSSLHLSFAAYKGRVTVTDLGTKNGTYYGQNHCSLVPRVPHDVSCQGVTLEIPGCKVKRNGVMLRWYPHAASRGSPLDSPPRSPVREVKEGEGERATQKVVFGMGDRMPLSQIQKPAGSSLVPQLFGDANESEDSTEDSLMDADANETQCVSSLPCGNSFTIPPLPVMEESGGGGANTPLVTTERSTPLPPMSPPPPQVGVGKTPLQKAAKCVSPQSRQSLEETLQMTMDPTLIVGSPGTVHKTMPAVVPAVVVPENSNGTEHSSMVVFSSTTSGVVDPCKVKSKLDFECDGSSDETEAEVPLVPEGRRRVKRKGVVSSKSSGVTSGGASGADSGVTSGVASGNIAMRPEVFIMTTGIIVTPTHQDSIARLAGKVVDDPTQCTHLVTDDVKRTVKMLCAMSTCKYVLKKEWLVDSLEHQRWEDPEKYRHHDTQVEKRFKFSITEAIQRRERSAVFAGLVFHVTATVSLQPGPLGIKDIIKCGGGHVSTAFNATKDDIVVTCPEDAALCNERHCLALHFVTLEWIYLAALRQCLPSPEENLVLRVQPLQTPCNGTLKNNRNPTRKRKRVVLGNSSDEDE